MIPYFLLLLFSFLFCFVAKTNEKHKYIIGAGETVSQNNFAVPIFFFIVWLLLACRSVDVGIDTSVYKQMFDFYSKQSFAYLFNDDPEPLYRLLNWLVGRFTDDFHIYLAIVAAITVIPIYVLYKQDRRHSYLKIVLFANLSVFVMLFSGLRQAIAMSIGLIAYSFVKKKKLIAFLITVIIAMGFHTSAFMLFAMYPLYYLRLKKKHIYIIVPLIAIVYIFNKPIFGVLFDIMTLFETRFDEIAMSNTSAMTMIIVFVAFTLFAYIIPDDENVDAEFIGLRNYLLLATLLQCFTPLHTLAMRMNYYYILFVPIIIPKVVEHTSVRWKQVAKVAEIVLCVFFTLYFVLNIVSSYGENGLLKTVPYIPFWKG